MANGKRQTAKKNSKPLKQQKLTDVFRKKESNGASEGGTIEDTGDISMQFDDSTSNQSISGHSRSVNSIVIVDTISAPVPVSSYDEKWNEKSIHIFDGEKKGRKKVHCIVCKKYPDTVQRLSYNHTLPAIATESGTTYRVELVSDHLASCYHKQCVKMEKIKLLEFPSPILTAMDAMISKANEKKATEIGKLMIHVYTDAKRLNLSARSWPARLVTAQSALQFSFNEKHESVIPNDMSLSYVNTPTHLTLMTSIVKADRDSLSQKLTSCLALSLRVDGSIDRTQKDKIYVISKIATADGDLDLIFLGVGEQKERKAIGLLNTVLSTIKENFGDQILLQIIRKVSSICTDGTNLNSGDQGGLWALLEEEKLKAGSDISLLKIWCVAHRSNLAFQDMEEEVPDVSSTLNVLSKISSHFHSSAIRTAELHKIAQDNKLNVLSMPKIFTIRWTQYIFSLVRAVLTSWHALVLCFKDDTKTATSSGFLKFLTNEHNLRKITFIGDVLFHFMRLQKKLQSDSLTLLKMCADVKMTLSSLKDLISKRLLGGFEDKLNDSIVIMGDKSLLKGIDLENKESTRSTRRAQLETLQDYRTKVCDSLISRLSARLEIDSDLLNVLESFVSLKKSTDLKKIHEHIGKDLDLSSMQVQYNDLCEMVNVEELSLFKLVKFLCSPDRFDLFKEVTIAFSRILAATPHSADVERCISANNLLKTNQRYRLLVETENQYLYIHFNMPCLEKWCPRAAILNWLSDKNRRNTNIINSGKTIQQPYSNGIFEAAEEKDDEKPEKPFNKFNF